MQMPTQQEQTDLLTLDLSFQIKCIIDDSWLSVCALSEQILVISAATHLSSELYTTARWQAAIWNKFKSDFMLSF